MILQRGFEADPSPAEPQSVTKTADGQTLINGLPLGVGGGQATLQPVGTISRLPDDRSSTGPVGPVEFYSTLQQSEVVL